MALASDYKVTFGYGATDGYYYGPQGVVGPSHRGNDRPTPQGTPIVVGSTTIGLTGSSGLASGPHLHTQAGKDEWCQNTIDPTPYDFKPGTVVHTGYASAWGNYIIVKVSSGRFICYAHLSKVFVKVGQVLPAKKPAPKPSPVKKKQYVRFMGDYRSVYRVLPFNRVGKKKGELRPNAFGGHLDYRVLKRKGDYVKVRTAYFGVGWVFVGDSVKHLTRFFKR